MLKCYASIAFAHTNVRCFAHAMCLGACTGASSTRGGRRQKKNTLVAPASASSRRLCSSLFVVVFGGMHIYVFTNNMRRKNMWAIAMTAPIYEYSRYPPLGCSADAVAAVGSIRTAAQKPHSCKTEAPLRIVLNWKISTKTNSRYTRTQHCMCT